MSTETTIGEGTSAGRLRPAFEWTPARITGLYLLLGFAALVVFDVLVVPVLDDPLLASVQAAKGGLEVLATGGFIFLLTRRSRAQLRRKNAVLERQREELEVLHRVLRHNLRNALTVITGTAAYLRTTATLDAEGVDHCERIETRAERLASMVEQASRIRRITESEGHRVTVDLAETVHDVVERYDDRADVSVDVPANESVAVNRLFEDAFGELVENAVQHGDGERPAVDVEAHAVDGTIRLTIADAGPGVPAAVSEVFERGEFDQLLHLEGMGLWFAYWTITDADGTFAIRDNDRGGTTVELTLQRATTPDVATAPPKPV